MFELVGVQKYDFKDEKTGNQVRGTKIHFIMDPDPQQKAFGFTGKLVGTKSFPADGNFQIPSALQCGKFYDFILSYNGGKNAKVLGFREVKV